MARQPENKSADKSSANFKSDDSAVRVCAVCCGYQNDDVLKKCALVRVGQKIKVLGRCDKIEWRDKKRIELTQGRFLDN